MPGRFEPFASAKAKIVQSGVDRVVCLAPLEEVRQKSTEYACAIEQGALPWAHEAFGVPDYQAPKDLEAFLRLTQSVARRLRSGESILIHCGAGIGRTGTLAVCVLMALGVAEPQARKNVANAGSGPERPSQEDVIRWMAHQVLKK
jgi:protein-tyrosine phosphatase